jgi:diguanylate cyclase (GGDEF)-like protein
MGRFLYTWRYYSFGREQYYKCLDGLFTNNLYNLRQANILVVVFAICYTIISLFIEKSFVNAGVYLVIALIALLFAVYTNYKMQTEYVNNKFIYIFTVLYYINIMVFGIYLGVFSTPDKLATVYLCFLICALLMFINGPLFDLCLTLCAVSVFIVCTVIVKSPENATYDIIGTIIAGAISLYFNWHICKLRLGLEISTNMLEDERNSYINQSTIDELTQLNNRRDFMNTFHRYLSNYRTSDSRLCIAIADIDFFKNYNDHYGHPKGDDCLRSVGLVFNKLKESMGIYTARVGGEEFALLWFEKETSLVDNVIAAMNDMIRELKIPHEKSNVSEYVTISIGVYIERLGESQDMETLYDLADKALYIAKGGGRNCAIITGREIEQYRITASS